MSNLKPCVFTINGDKMSYDEARQYLLDKYDELSVSELPSGVRSEKQQKINDAIDEAAKFVKNALKVQSRDVVSMGFDTNQLIDNLAKAAKILVDAGIDVAEAVKTVLDKAEKQINRLISEGNLDASMDLAKEVEKAVSAYNKPSEVKKRLRGTIETFVNRSDIPESIKEKLLADEDSYLVQLGRDNAIALAKEVIESIGGIEAALNAMDNESANIPVDIRSIIYGEGLNWAKENRLNSTTQEDIDTWADRENAIHQKLAAKATAYGRFIAYLFDVYQRSGYAMVRETKKAIERRNKVMRPNAKKLATRIKAILDDLTHVGDSVSEALSSTTQSSIAALKSRIRQLEENQKKSKESAKPGKNPVAKSRVAPKDAKDTISFLLSFGSSSKSSSGAQPSNRNVPADADPEVIKGLQLVGRYFVQLGYTSFDEFYKKINKELKGKFEVHYADVYNNSRDLAIEDGADPKLFTSAAEVEKVADDKFEELARIEKELQDAKDELARARKKLAIENLMKEPTPPSGAPVTKEQKLRTLAAELDTELGGTSYTDIVEAFIGKKKSIAEKNKAIAKRTVFESMMKDSTPSAKDRVSKVEKLKSMAKELDAAFETTIYSNAVENFIEKKKSQEEIKAFYSKKNAFDSLMKESTPSSTTPITKEQKLKTLASELDALSGTTAYTDALNSYNQIQQLKEQSRKLDNKKKAFIEALKTKPPRQQAGVSAEEKLRATAAELDAELGGTAYTDALEDYLRNKLQKDFIDKLSKTHKKTLSKGKTSAQKLREEAQKLDNIFGTTSYSDAAESYLLNKEVKKDIQEFYRMMSAGRASTTARDTRTKEQKLLDAAAELDASTGGNSFTMQAQAFLAMGSNISDIVEQALIDAGFSKKIIDPKTGNKIEVVDWNALTTDSKSSASTIAKIRQAIIDKYGANSPILSQLSAIEQHADKLIADKKAIAINAELKRISRAKNKVKGIIGNRRSNIQKMLDKWKQGAFGEQQIMDEMAEELGLISISQEDQVIIEEMLDLIDKAPTGVEKERIEERLQAFLTYKRHPTFALSSFRQWMKGSLLTGFVTAIKNFTGGTLALSQVMKEYITAQIKAGGDAAMNKTLARSIKKALRVALDIFFNGGVDPGVAQSEITGTKEGSPSVRFMENRRSDLGMRKALYYPAKVWDSIPKYVLRGIGSVDAFFNILLQDTRTYNLARTMIKESNPNLSSAEANRMAFEETWGMEIYEAEIQAEKEFLDRGISIDGAKGRMRFRRRVDEIVEQKRKPEIVKSARSFGSRNTFKEHDWGVASIVGSLWSRFTSLLEGGIKWLRETDSKLAWGFANALEFSTGLTIDLLTPFVKGTANFMEKGLEHFPVYGLGKASIYGAIGLESKIKGDDAKDNFNRAGEYVWNAMIGLALTAFITSLADDDDEDKEKAIYGAGSEDWDELRNRKKQRPANSIVINGHTIMFDMFGPLSIPLRIKAAQMDKNRYAKEAGVGVAIDVLTNMITSPYLETPGQIIRNVKKGEYSTLLKRQGTEFVTRAGIPAASFFRQAGQMYKPQAMTPVTFMENLYKQGGIFTISKLNRPAFDYRGKTYDQGEINPGSPDGMIKMMGKKSFVDDVDKFVFKYAPSVGVVNTDTDAYKVYDNGSFRPLTDEEKYDYKFSQATKFNRLLEKYFKSNPESLIKDSSYIEATEQELTASDIKKAEIEVSEENQGLTREELTLVAKKKALENKLNGEIKERINELSTIASRAAYKETVEKYGLELNEAFKEATDEYNFELEYIE